jgi:hypothetical protein
MLHAPTASASPTVGWKAVSTNSNWYCNEQYTTHVDKPGVKFKACIVRNSNGDAQAVLVVQNVSGERVNIDGRIVFESQRGGDIWCDDSPLENGFTRGCYGKTVLMDRCERPGTAVVTLGVNGSNDTVRRTWDKIISC